MNVRTTMLLLMVGGVAQAEVRPAAVFSDHMVLQRAMPVPVWGSADAGEKVTLKFHGQVVTATADDHGNWMVKLQPMEADAAGSELLLAGKDNAVTLHDVLVGEVWLCSGQSNMGRTVASTTTRNTALKRAANPLIRLFDLKGAPTNRWQLCTAETADVFSAPGYFFGRELQAELKIPVGLVWAAVGGTSMDYWIDPAVALREPAYAERLQRFIAEYRDFQAKTAEEKAKVAKPPKDPRVRLGQHYRSYIAPFQPFALRGVLWYQGEANASDEQFAGELTALIRNWREAWGQGDFPFLLVQYPPWANRSGKYYPTMWERQKQVVANVPNIGLIVGLPVMSWRDIHPPNKEPLGRLSALQALKVAYGRTNIVAQGPTFRSLEIKDGRAVLRFDSIGSGLVARGTQMLGFSMAGSDGEYVPARAVWTPSGKIEVSSPQVAKPVGVRYRQVTGEVVEEVEFSAARIAEEQRTGTGDGEKRATLENRGDRILVDLDLIGGDRPAEVNAAGSLESFAVAGKDGRWMPAEARIDGDTVVVSSPQVKEPIAVRYGWYADATAEAKVLMPATLWNREGLPAAPFRTDDFLPRQARGDQLLTREQLDFYKSKPAAAGRED